MNRPTSEKKRFRPRAKQFMWSRYALYLGGMGKTEWHAHHMIQVVFSLDRPFKIRREENEPYMETRGVVIPSDVPHQVRVWRSQTVILWLDPEGDDGRYFTGAQFIPIAADLLDRWAAELPEPYEAAADCTAAQQLMDRIVGDLTQRRQAQQPPDGRIQLVQAHIEQHLTAVDSAQLAVGRLAEVANLSESRLMHLFREEMGLTIRRYILWARLLTAVNIILSGASLTDAAHGAGFADAAHMNRTYKAMLGMVPSETYRNSRFIQLFSCGSW